MAKTREFPLRMGPGVLARTIEDLQEHYNASRVLEEYKSARLERWLRSEGYETQATQVAALDPEAKDLEAKLREILFASPTEGTQETKDLGENAERLRLLEGYPRSREASQNLDRVAFNQADMEKMTRELRGTIYLCGEEFTVPSSANGVTYVGVNNPKVKLGSTPLTGRIDFKDVDFDVLGLLRSLRETTALDESGTELLDEDDIASQKYMDLFGQSLGLGLRLANDAMEQLNTPEMQAFAGDLYRKARGDAFRASGLYKKAADQGYPAALFKLGCCYMDGYGVAPNAARGLSLMQEAADKGYLTAQLQMAMNYELGEEVVRDQSKACEWYKEAVKQGSLVAQYNLGIHYLIGEGVPQDEKEGYNLLLNAAKQDYGPAQEQVGFMYLLGEGVPEDENKAFKWLKKAADRGLPGGQHAIGRLYLEGRVVPQSDEEAVKWFQKSAAQGYDVATRDLGFCYANGRGIAKDLKKGMQMIRAAAEEGDAEAMLWMGKAYFDGLGVDYGQEEARDWVLQAADQGHPEALTMMLTSLLDDFQVGLLNSLMQEVDDPYNFAIRMLQEAEFDFEFRDIAHECKAAAENENPDAQFLLGLLYALGLGYKQNDKVACQWFRKAGLQGHSEAAYAMGLSYHAGAGVRPNESKEKKWFADAAKEGYEPTQPLWIPEKKGFSGMPPTKRFDMTQKCIENYDADEHKLAKKLNVSIDQALNLIIEVEDILEHQYMEERVNLTQAKREIKANPNESQDIEKRFERKIWLLAQLSDVINNGDGDDDDEIQGFRVY